MEKIEFVVRTYLIVYNPTLNKVLVSYENFKGNKLTKFIGGGVEPGESFLNAVKREVSEEVYIKSLSPFTYLGIPDSLSPSKFAPDKIVLPIYFAASTKEEECQLQPDVYSNSTLEAVEWEIIDEAYNNLTFESDKWAVNRFKGLI